MKLKPGTRRRSQVGTTLGKRYTAADDGPASATILELL
jgi:hypothetical protein